MTVHKLINNYGVPEAQDFLKALKVPITQENVDILVKMILSGYDAGLRQAEKLYKNKSIKVVDDEVQIKLSKKLWNKMLSKPGARI